MPAFHFLFQSVLWSYVNMAHELFCNQLDQQNNDRGCNGLFEFPTSRHQIDMSKPKVWFFIFTNKRAALLDVELVFDSYAYD